MGWGGGGVVVDTYALLSSSPSLIWLQLGFGLARAVTIVQHIQTQKVWAIRKYLIVSSFLLSTEICIINVIFCNCN